MRWSVGDLARQRSWCQFGRTMLTCRLPACEARASCFQSFRNNNTIKKITKEILSVDKNSNCAFKSSELGLETTLYFQNSITEILKKIDSLNIDRVLISNLDKFEIPRGNYRVLKDIEVFNFKSLSHSPNKTSR